MTKKFATWLASYFFLHSVAFGQSTLLSPDDEQHHTLERMETLIGSFSDEIFLSQKGVARKDVVAFFFSQKTDRQSGYYTNIDMRLANDAIANSGEWLPPHGKGAYVNKRPLLGFIYPTKNDFLSYNEQNIYFSLNPIFQTAYVGENLLNGLNTTNQKNNFLFQGGFAVRTKIKNWIGADVTYVYNQEQVPSYFANYVTDKNSNPNFGFYETQNNFIVNNFLKANVHVPLLKDHITLSLGYDQHVIGDGHRSLMLSNFSGNALYGSLRTKIWKFQYQNLFLKYDQQRPSVISGSNENKYAAIHHLSINVFPWLNVGLFESVIFNRADRYEFGYLNPVIFYRSIERSMGSPDKLIVGLNAKAIVAKRINLFGQFIINEFTAKEFFSNSGYWANKWGAQLGFKYYDVFGIPNLDMHIEGNMVRPYTYAAQMKIDGNSLANYSHQNLALAHPLGAGFQEAIVAFKYRPAMNWSIDVNGLAYRQGVDTDTLNYGNNILKDYNLNIPNRHGVSMIHGIPKTVLLANLNVSYQWWPNMFIDLGATFRNQSMLSNNSQSITYYGGIRMNIGRRNYAIF